MSNEYGTASESDETSSRARGDIADMAIGNDTPMQNGASKSEHTIDALFQKDMSAVMMLPFAEARAYALREFDRYFLTAALERNAGNIARTARALGLHRQSLQKLMTRRGLKANRIEGAIGSPKRLATADGAH